MTQYSELEVAREMEAIKVIHIIMLYYCQLIVRPALFSIKSSVKYSDTVNKTQSTRKLQLLTLNCSLFNEDCPLTITDHW